MVRHSYYSPDEVLRMLYQPATLAHPPGGGVRIKKAGVVGAGETRQEAASDWCRRFTEMISRPKDHPPA